AAWIEDQSRPVPANRLAIWRGPRPRSSRTPKPAASTRLALPPLPLASTVKRSVIPSPFECQSGFDRLFLAFHRPAAAFAAAHLLVPPDGANVTPVVDLVQLALDEAACCRHLQDLAARQQLAGQTHRPIQQGRVFEEQPAAAV